MTNFKTQYRIDIRHEPPLPIPYADENKALRQIRGHYRTARRGNPKNGLETQLWHRFYSEIWNHRRGIPQAEDFDVWHKTKTRKLSRLLAINSRWRIGIAQKMLNLLLKELWAWEEIDPGVVPSLHAPLDSVILSRFRGVPTAWQRWTKVTCIQDTFDQKYEEYAVIQQKMREYHDEVDFFDSVIETEQFLWHRIDLRYLG